MISLLNFRFYPRKSKKYGEIFYYRIKMPGEPRGTGHSTYQCTETAAETYVQNLIEQGFFSEKSTIKFSKFAENWWLWDQCLYVKNKKRKGKSITRSYVKVCRLNLTKHILPYFKDLKLCSITSQNIEKWSNDLFEDKKKNLSPTTVNHCLGTLKTMLREAVRLDYLSRDPSERISQFKKTPKEKSILSVDQVREMISEENIGRIWSMNLTHYTIHLLASLCGMRMGEIQALKIKYVNFQENIIYIAHAWERGYGLKGPKCDSKRFITAPKIIFKYIKIIINSNEFNSPDDLIFYNKDRFKPVGHKTILKKFYEAIYKIGIPEEQRKKINVTFHSCRHFFNSYLRHNNIKDHKIRNYTGHKSEDMTDAYTKFKSEDFNDVKDLQEQLVG